MRKEFRVYKLDNKSMSLAEDMACMFDGLVEELEKMCLDCEEFSIARRKLEEACFYAKKAMSRKVSGL